MRHFLSFWKNDSGATSIEYALIATLISVAIIGALGVFGNSMTNMFNNISNAVTSNL